MVIAEGKTYSGKSNLLLDSEFRFNYGGLLWTYCPEYKGIASYFVLLSNKMKQVCLGAIYQYLGNALFI